jgi:sporulation protein YlmC with PRC-barrel domain
MRVDLDAKVRTRDGEDVGSVQHAVVDPRTNEVTDFVISTGALFGRDIVVAREELDRATEQGDALRLRLSKDELEALPSYSPADYVVPPAGTPVPPGIGFAATGFLWPASYGYLAGVPAEYARSEEVGIGRGADVLDREEVQVGIVEDVRFDAATGRLQGFVLRVGRPLLTLFGGGDTVEVPAEQIERVEEGRVRLRVSKDYLARAGR